MQRREFIRTSALLPAFLNGFALHTSKLGVTEAAIGDDHVLVLVQLNGGNDGLNTVIPLEYYANYQSVRKNIAIPEARVWKVDDGKIGLHPSMVGMGRLYNEGKLRIVQSVGYPNPDFSHFRAADIWNTASDSNKFVSSGWAGRMFSLYHPNYPNNYPSTANPDPLAINIGSVISPALQGPVSGMGLAITNPSAFYKLIDNKYDNDVPNSPAGRALAYLRQTATQTNLYSQSIKSAADKVTRQETYPTGNGLAAQLKIVAQLIAGGLKTKLYIVSMGGFDTHDTQVVATDTATGNHANLMKNLSDAIETFMKDIQGLGVSKRVLGMTFSEFGRRVKSNDSGGTDHGAAAPLFVFGDRVNGGVSGKTPTIAATAKTDDNVPMQYDFRSVYASILQDWFCMNEADLQNVLLKNFQSMNIVEASACGITLSQQEEVPDVQLIENYPNPFTDFTNIRFTTRGGHTMIQIFDNMGRLVVKPIDDTFLAGQFDVPINTSNWASGLYYARLQNGMTQEVRKMVKA